MKLTDEQKGALQALTKHPGYAVLKLIDEDANVRLWKMFGEVDVEDEQTRGLIKRNQLYARARSDFFRDTEKHVREVYTPTV